MQLTLLGSGDAIGTPKIGCVCDQCTRALHEGRQRLRTSLLVQSDGKSVLIDTSPDLRQQLLASGAPRIDAVLWTHGHYDHFAGYSEFYRVQKLPAAYAVPEVISYIRDQLHFMPIPGCPRKQYEPFSLFGVNYTFFTVNHPPIPSFGVCIEYNSAKIVFTGDTRRDIPEASMDLIHDPDLLFADAIVPGGITIGKHMNYDDACDLARVLEAEELKCVHLSHLVPWDTPDCGMDGEKFTF